MSASTTRAPSTGAIGGSPARDSLTRRFLARTESKVGLVLTAIVLIVAVLGPVAQVVAMQLAWLAGGIVVIEVLFRYPGIGQAMVDAVNNRDVQVVQTISLLIAAFYVVVNLLADVVGILANPKLRTESGR